MERPQAPPHVGCAQHPAAEPDSEPPARSHVHWSSVTQTRGRLRATVVATAGPLFLSRRPRQQQHLSPPNPTEPGQLLTTAPAPVARLAAFLLTRLHGVRRPAAGGVPAAAGSVRRRQQQRAVRVPSAARRRTQPVEHRVGGSQGLNSSGTLNETRGCRLASHTAGIPSHYRPQC